MGKWPSYDREKIASGAKNGWHAIDLRAWISILLGLNLSTFCLSVWMVYDCVSMLSTMGVWAGTNPHSWLSNVQIHQIALDGITDSILKTRYGQNLDHNVSFWLQISIFERCYFFLNAIMSRTNYLSPYPETMVRVPLAFCFSLVNLSNNLSQNLSTILNIHSCNGITSPIVVSYLRTQPAL